MLLVFVFSTPALSSDGVLEINQTCAVNTGCFAGDAPGYPITIDGSVGKSYRLTGDLVVPDENTDGIVVAADYVSVDLGGFEIRGSVSCTGSTGKDLSCAPASGSGIGVKGASVLQTGISVRNGSIHGMGDVGLQLGPAAVVSGIRARSNGGRGIRTGPGSVISRNTAYQNGGIGIGSVQGASTISDNAAYQNGSTGISTSPGSTISNNTLYENGGDGIFANNASTVLGNTTYNNGGDGIQASQGSLVRNNVAFANDGWGLNLSTSAAYGGNTIRLNGSGTVTGGANILLNYCDGANLPACP